jgi:hypothetical protein
MMYQGGGPEENKQAQVLIRQQGGRESIAER